MMLNINILHDFPPSN